MQTVLQHPDIERRHSDLARRLVEIRARYPEPHQGEAVALNPQYPAGTASQTPKA